MPELIDISREELNNLVGILAAFDTSCTRGSIHCIEWNVKPAGSPDQPRKIINMHCTECGLSTRVEVGKFADK